VLKTFNKKVRSFKKKADRTDHVNQFKHSLKKKYQKFINPKSAQFKDKGQSSKSITSSTPKPSNLQIILRVENWHFLSLLRGEK
jgi:hypothetical protein